MIKVENCFLKAYGYNICFSIRKEGEDYKHVIFLHYEVNDNQFKLMSVHRNLGRFTCVKNYCDTSLEDAKHQTIAYYKETFTIDK